MIEERIDDGFPTAAGLNRVQQVFWGARYVDDLVARRTDRGAGTNGLPDEDYADANEQVYWALTDAQFSVRGLISATTGRVVERVSYDAYGVGRHCFPGDTDGDGSFGPADLSALNAATASNTVPRPITDPGCNPDLDVNADGTIDGGDYTALGVNPGTTIFTTGMPAGRISSGGNGSTAPDNDVGYCGYLFNHETQDYHVRFRAYSPRWGRWLQRDPAGYVDGGSLVEYVGAGSLIYGDPYGLKAEPACDPPCPKWDEDKPEWNHRAPQAAFKTKDGKQRFKNFNPDAKEMGWIMRAANHRGRDHLLSSGKSAFDVHDSWTKTWQEIANKWAEDGVDVTSDLVKAKMNELLTGNNSNVKDWNEWLNHGLSAEHDYNEWKKVDKGQYIQKRAKELAAAHDMACEVKCPKSAWSTIDDVAKNSPKLKAFKANLKSKGLKALPKGIAILALFTAVSSAHADYQANLKPEEIAAKFAWNMGILVPIDDAMLYGEAVDATIGTFQKAAELNVRKQMRHYSRPLTGSDPEQCHPKPK